MMFQGDWNCRPGGFSLMFSSIEHQIGYIQEQVGSYTASTDLFLHWLTPLPFTPDKS